jgi:hypothetical protein
MRTSLNNIKAIDDYIFNRLAPGDTLLFEANMLLDIDLANGVKQQQSTHAIIRQYGRQKIREEIISVQNILASAPQHRAFRLRIAKLFTKQ